MFLLLIITLFQTVEVTHEPISLLFQFGGFIVALLGLVVTIVVALTKKK
ncbi:putative holin-like toxin [Brevibacillus laterosporus]